MSNKDGYNGWHDLNGGSGICTWWVNMAIYENDSDLVKRAYNPQLHDTREEVVDSLADVLETKYTRTVSDLNQSSKRWDMVNWNELANNRVPDEDEGLVLNQETGEFSFTSFQFLEGYEDAEMDFERLSDGIYDGDTEPFLDEDEDEMGIILTKLGIYVLYDECHYEFPWELSGKFYPLSTL